MSDLAALTAADHELIARAIERLWLHCCAIECIVSRLAEMHSAVCVPSTGALVVVGVAQRDHTTCSAFRRALAHLAEKLEDELCLDVERGAGPSCVVGWALARRCPGDRYGEPVRLVDIARPHPAHAARDAQLHADRERRASPVREAEALRGLAARLSGSDANKCGAAGSDVPESVRAVADDIAHATNRIGCGAATQMGEQPDIGHALRNVTELVGKAANRDDLVRAAGWLVIAILAADDQRGTFSAPRTDEPDDVADAGTRWFTDALRAVLGQAIRHVERENYTEADLDNAAAWATHTAVKIATAGPWEPAAHDIDLSQPGMPERRRWMFGGCTSRYAADSRMSTRDNAVIIHYGAGKELKWRWWLYAPWTDRSGAGAVVGTGTVDAAATDPQPARDAADAALAAYCRGEAP